MEKKQWLYTSDFDRWQRAIKEGLTGA